MADNNNSNNNSNNKNPKSGWIKVQPVFKKFETKSIPKTLSKPVEKRDKSK